MLCDSLTRSGEHTASVFLFISYMRLLFRDYALLSLRIVLDRRLCGAVHLEA
jgi:hypothetical protein